MMTRIVIAAYRPKPGKAGALKRLMREHLPTLRAQSLVTDRPSIMMEAGDGTIIEVFEWASREAMEAAHTNPAVLQMWEEYAQVCDYVPVGQVEEASQLFSEFTPFG
jgi:quinol monooxygenase YgiN